MGQNKKNAPNMKKRKEDGQNDSTSKEKKNAESTVMKNQQEEQRSTVSKQKSSIGFYLFLLLLAVMGGMTAIVFTNDEVRESVSQYASTILPENVVKNILSNTELFKRKSYPKPRIIRTREPVKEDKKGDKSNIKKGERKSSETGQDGLDNKNSKDKIARKPKEVLKKAEKLDDNMKQKDDDKSEKFNSKSCPDCLSDEKMSKENGVQKPEEIQQHLNAEKEDEDIPKNPDEKNKKFSKKDYSKISITNDYDYKIKKKLDAADDLLEKEKFDEAIAAYNSIIDKYPRSVRALYGTGRAINSLSEIKQSNSLLEEAIEVLSKILSQPNVPKELMIKAGLFLSERQKFRGWSAKSLKTLKVLSDLYPEEVDVKNKLGVGYLIQGKNDRAKEIFREVLQKDPENGFAKVHLGFIIKVNDDKPFEAIPLLKEGMFSEQPGTNDGRFYFHLGDALQRTNQTDEAYAIYKRGAERKVFLSAEQRSLYNVDRLTGRPWWTPEQSTYQKQLKMLEDNWKVIRDEGLAQLDPKTGAFQSEDENLREKGEWKQLTLYQRGRKNNKNCEKTPKTCALLERVPDAISCTRGQIKFSVMHPGVHVWPHCGPTNCRIRAHLGLKIPDGPKIRVTSDTRKWKEGKFIIIDDSFEHEVWHDGTELRLILIVDFWHPELTVKERRTLSPI